MSHNIDISFANLTTKYNVVIEHVNEVNGFADSVRHLDAFYNIGTTLNLKWIVPVFRNSRSSNSGTWLPYEITGISDFLEYHCSSSRTLVNGPDVTCINIDFNRLVSGDRDAQIGISLISGFSREELFSIIRRGLIETIETAEKENKIKTKRMGLFKRLSRFVPLTPHTKSLPVIHFRVFINRLPIITKFSDVKKFSNALFEFNTKNSTSEDNSSGLNVVLHLRKGDTTVFPLPDGRFIASWGDFRNENNRRALPEIIEKVSDSVYQHYDIEPYLSLIKKIAAASSEAVELSFLCDGFDRGLRRVEDHMELAAKEIQHIRNWASAEEERLKKAVSGLINTGINSVDIIWGEGEELFERSFQSIKAADVLLFSTGGFAKSIFNYFNNVPDSIAIGSCTEKTEASDICALTESLKRTK